MRRRMLGAGLVSVVVIASCSSGDDAETSTRASTASSEPGASTTEAAPTSSAPTSSAPATTAPTSTAPPTSSLPGDADDGSVGVAPGPQPPTGAPTPSSDELASFEWRTANADAPWAARAGLRVVELGDRLLLLGGRTPNQSTIPGDSAIWGDVWASDDDGVTWTDLFDGGSAPWPPRAYFQAVVKDEMVYVIGGQDFGIEPNPFCALLEQGVEPPPWLGIDPDAPCPEFLPTSTFFNDVWRSDDGVTWEQVTAGAPWKARAGLSAEVLGDHIYVLAGSQNDDSSIVGAGGPARKYFNDVWRSVDGAEWELMTDAAPWEPRAGAATVVRDDLMFVFGGEDGFTCDPLPNCEPPYFNDVWVTADGAAWEPVTEAAAWSPRPGHVCNLVGNRFLCFGGFGLIENPTDMWISSDGAAWEKLALDPWGSNDPDDMRYDFDSIVIESIDGNPVVLTVGGDRETFDFTDPENYLRVDNDVWSFAMPSG